jgi:hypothetical protein
MGYDLTLTLAYIFIMATIVIYPDTSSETWELLSNKIQWLKKNLRLRRVTESSKDFDTFFEIDIRKLR